MVTVREATAADFPKVYPLFLLFENPYIAKEQWQQLFVDHWGLQNGQFGYVLVDGEEIVGFLATTFSERTFHGEKMRLCNWNAWVVKDAYRAHSLTLLAKMLRDKKTAITNLTPTPQVLKMCAKLGFTMMDKTQRIIVPSPKMLGGMLGGNVEIITDTAKLDAALTGEHRKIFRDHQLPWNRHALIRSKEGDSYVVMNRSMKSLKGNVRVPMARVHYVSDIDIFVKYADRLVLSAMTHFFVVAMIIEERMLKGRKIWHSFQRPGTLTGAYRSDKLAPDEIDNLYTEAILMNA